MKINVAVGVCIAIMLLTVGSASAWLDPYTHRQSINLNGGSDGAQTGYQMKFDVTHATNMTADFDDLRFTESDGTTFLDAWLEEKTDSTSAVIWVETDTPADASASTIYMYYGNATAANNWDGDATFVLYTGLKTTNYGSSLDVSGPGYAYRGNVQYGSTSSSFLFGFGDSAVRFPSNSIIMSTYTPGNHLRKVYVGGAEKLNAAGSLAFAAHTPYIYDIVWGSSGCTWYKDGVQWSTMYTGDTPTANVGIFNYRHSGAAQVNWQLVRKYVTSPATYAFGSEETKPIIPPSVPAIVAYNNITGTRAHVPLTYDTTVMFNATAGDSITWSWTLDGVDQSTSADNYIHTFSAGFGYYAVTVNATNTLGTDTYTWGIWENIETTAETIPTFTDTSYQMLLDSIDYPPDMEEFGKAMAHPFVQMVGVIFYLFIFGIPLLMMYIRQDNMTMPTTLLFIFGSIIIFMLPPQWQIIAGALMTLGFVGILFKLYKERER